MTSEQEIEIDRLDNLQKMQNQGRGVSCVRSIILYLRKEDVESAQIVAETEFDKIRSYPEIVSKLKEMCLVADDRI